MKIIYYTITMLSFLTIGGCLFMLVKTWIMMQVIFIFKGKYEIRPKDKFWNRPGWFTIIVFCLFLMLFNILIIMDNKF